jgi:hypothetical protein
VELRWEAVQVEAELRLPARLESDLKLLPEEIAAAPKERFITYCLRMGARNWYDPAFDATEPSAPLERA